VELTTQYIPRDTRTIRSCLRSVLKLVDIRSLSVLEVWQRKLLTTKLENGTTKRESA
jgi:hypothetical protein